MMVQRILSAQFVAGVAVFAATLGLYLATLAPTLTWGWKGLGVDGGELLAAAYTLGIPHPPGYPTYTLLLKVFATIVPVGDFAFRGNLLSALLASGSVVLMYLTVLRFCRYLWPDAPRWTFIMAGVLSSTVLATSPMFWSQAVMTEVYALNAFFAAALLLVATHLVLRLRRPTEKTITSRLAVFGLLLGLGLGNHLTLLAVAAPLLYWIGSSIGWRKLLSPWAVGGLVLGLGVYLYLPIRASQDPAVNWGNASSVGGIAWMLTGRPYQSYVFGVPAEAIPSRMGAWLELVFTQFNPLGLFIGLVGVQALRGREFRYIIATVASMAILTAYTLTYHTFDFRVFMIPAFLLFSTWIGIGFCWIVTEGVREFLGSRMVSPRNRVRLAAIYPPVLLAAGILFLLPGISVILNYSSQDLSSSREASRYARQVRDAVPDGAVILSNDERSVFSLWYLRNVEDQDWDVAVIAAQLLQYDWYVDDRRRMFPDRIPSNLPRDVPEALTSIIDHNVGNSRVFLTYHDSSLSESYDLELREPIFEVVERRSP